MPIEGQGSRRAREGHRAFTLAEVLITLGVIGVVAALTLPTLMSNYRAKTTMTKLKKFYTTMSQAQLLSINDNGDVEGWDWVKAGEESNNEIILAWFNKYWGKYLNSFEVIDKKKLDENDELTDDGIVVKFSDGTIAKFSDFSGGYLHINYYTNYKTFMNNTAQSGKDKFLFGFNPNPPSGDKSCKRFGTYLCVNNDVEDLKNNSLAGCYSTSAERGGAYCSRLLEKYGWEVPEDYPYKF